MVDSAFEKVGDCFLPTMRMVGEACAWVDGEVVEHKERRKVGELGGSDGAADAGTGAFRLFDCEEGLADGAGGGHVDGLGRGEEGRWREELGGEGGGVAAGSSIGGCR